MVLWKRIKRQFAWERIGGEKAVEKGVAGGPKMARSMVKLRSV